MNESKPTKTIGRTRPASEQPRLRGAVHTAAKKSEAVGLRIFKNIVALIGGQGVSLALSGITTILLARYLGTARLGEFGAIYAYLGLYGWLTTFGLDTILARHVAQNREQAGSILLTGVVVTSFFALGATLIALVVAPWFGYAGPLRGMLALAAVDILLLTPLRLPAMMFQVDLRQWYGIGIRLVRQALWLAILVAAAAARSGLPWIVAGRSLCAVVEVMLVLIAVRHRGFLTGPWKLLVADVRKFVAYGLPVAISVLAVGIYNRIDQVMLHTMVNDKVLGNYVAAVRLAELVNVLPIAIMASLFPVLAQSTDQEDRFRHLLRLSFRCLMLMAMAGCIFTTLFSAPIIRLIYGSKFAPAGPLLAVLIWSEVPVFFGVVISNALVAKNLQNYLPLSTGVGAVINVGLNLYLIPRWGAMGAAWATNVSYALAGILLFLMFSRTRPVASLGVRILLPLFAVTLVITQIMSALSLPQFIRFAAALLLYGLGAWLMGSVQRADFEHLSRLIGRTFAFSRSNEV